jgi:hypothetical protein
MTLFSLDDQGLERLMAAAALLPPHLRDPFTRSVAGRVSGMPNVGMAELEHAIQFVLGNFGIAGGADAFNGKHDNKAAQARQQAERIFR